MKRIMTALILLSIPVLLMTQALQAYRYVIAFEEMTYYGGIQTELLEDNKRLLAGIAVFSAPERVYTIGHDDLGLKPSDPDEVLQVWFPETYEGER